MLPTIEELVQAELAMSYPPSYFLDTRVVFLLGARLLWDATQNSWRTAGINDNLDQLTRGSEAGTRKKTPPLSSLRVQATRHIIRSHPNIAVVISGGTSSAKRPSSASVMRAELGPVFGTVILDEASLNTMDHFAHLPAITSFCLDDRLNTAMVTNAYHVPRVRAMLELPAVKAGLGRLTVSVVAAEAVIRSFNPGYPDFNEVYATNPFVQSAIELEGRGIEALQAGSYAVA